MKNQINSILHEANRGSEAARLSNRAAAECVHLQIKDGYVDTGAAPGKDTSWKDPSKLMPETTTKAAVANQRHMKKLLGVIPYGFTGQKDTAPVPPPTQTPVQQAPPTTNADGTPVDETNEAAACCTRTETLDEVSTAVFLVQSKEIRQKRTGEPYLSLTLSDRTGEIEARMWDNVAEIMDTFNRDDFIKVRGQLQIYNTRPQFIIHRLRRMQDAEVDFADFFPASARNPDEMWAELRAIVAGIPGRPHIRKHCSDAFLDDPDIASTVSGGSGGENHPSCVPCGSLSGTRAVALRTGAADRAAHYGTVDWSLMVAGIVLHDIGKIYELTYERGFAYSTEGQLVGHIPIAMRMLYDKLRAFPDFPEKLRTLVEHMILSHHGKLEFGSPKVPLFPEALLLHYLDDMDSKMECMRATAEKGAMAEGIVYGVERTA